MPTMMNSKSDLAPTSPLPRSPQYNATPSTSAANTVILCTAGYDHTIKFWEAPTGKCARSIPHPDSQVNRLVISPDKRFVAAASFNVVRMYDLTAAPAAGSTDPLMHVFSGHTGNITAVAFHGDSKWIVTGSEDGTVKIWDMRTCTIQRNFVVGASVTDVVIHPNWGEIVSCDQAGCIKIWDLGEAAMVSEFVPLPDVAMRSLTIATDGSCIIAANNQGRCYAWKLMTENDRTEFTAICSWSAHSAIITRAVLSPDVKLLATCSADNTVKIWNVANYSFTLDKHLKGHKMWVWDATFSADSAYLVTASSDNSARLWELASGETVKQYSGHTKALMCVALNDDATVHNSPAVAGYIPPSRSTAQSHASVDTPTRTR